MKRINCPVRENKLLRRQKIFSRLVAMAMLKRVQNACTARPARRCQEHVSCRETGSRRSHGCDIIVKRLNARYRKTGADVVSNTTNWILFFTRDIFIYFPDFFPAIFPRNVVPSCQSRRWVSFGRLIYFRDRNLPSLSVWRNIGEEDVVSVCERVGKK